MWQENQEEQAAVEHIASMKDDQGATSCILHYGPDTSTVSLAIVQNVFNSCIITNLPK